MERNREQNKEQNIVDVVVSVRRVTKVTTGGKRFAFSAFVVSGDQNGSIGAALGKSKEASSAIAKATARAKKNMIKVSLRGSTIPYPVTGKHGASKVILMSAYKGTGIIAGGAVRGVMEALGIQDVLAKSLGSSNQLNVVKATLNALSQLRSAQDLARLRGISVEELVKGSHVQAK